MVPQLAQTTPNQNQQRPGCAGKTGVAWACCLAERKHRAARGHEDLVMMEITPDHPSKDLLSEALPSHLLFTWLLDPTAFGVPNTRKRRYTVAVAPWLVAAMIEVPASVPAPLNTSVIDLVEDSRTDCQELGHRATLQTIHVPLAVTPVYFQAVIKKGCFPFKYD